MLRDSIKIDSGKTRMIAHRGLSALEQENTCPAFVAAGVKSYWGIETDVHITRDGKYILSHDGNLLRTGGVDIAIEETDFETIRSVPLFDKDGKSRRTDLFPATLDDYVQICSKYGKQSVLELKGVFPEKHIAGVVETFRSCGMYGSLTLISFHEENIIAARRLYADLDIEFLVWELTDRTVPFIQKYKTGLDVHFSAVDGNLVDAVHRTGGRINAWTVDDAEVAAKLVACGVDEITSNVLE